MNSKHLIIFFVFLMALISVHAEDIIINDGSSATEQSSTLVPGFDSFISNAIGENISVTISVTDNTLSGKLISAYSDGIYIQTAFNNYIFITKKSIAYIRITP
ncbi:MAG: hypothetical protein A2015_06875 [Spirochaetes bacterium GWF1_31_7]|nr:MAG: hypothetical protein A2Y30_09585 [Spirochaetes bacterium GWE1_32_154]OHD46554.1 MAG: hypothetical protein A2015_06875 [Spirochaetes bacterium GWF1_31_7]OHD49363.1 MAG: hypothetical protein A2Y29_03870 [Spirochaetes bacterium GWE2_31_10]HBD93103.1 hypothetical protein [Spirochaetia bacterium]HBI36780.1 hypothetical protein [Spirochaetia bacterium]